MHEPNKLTRLVLANCSELLTFALSRELASRLQTQFIPSPIVDQVLIDLPEQKADRALLEVGALLRALDDTDEVNQMLLAISDPPYGIVVGENGDHEDLRFRDMTNKILHARGFRWHTDAEHGPLVKCISGDPRRWSEASIWLERLVSLCHNLAARL